MKNEMMRFVYALKVSLRLFLDGFQLQLSIGNTFPNLYIIPSESSSSTSASLKRLILRLAASLVLQFSERHLLVLLLFAQFLPKLTSHFKTVLLLSFVLNQMIAP